MTRFTMTFCISIVCCFAMRFLEGVGGDAGGLLGMAKNRRRDDGPLTLPGPGIRSFVNLPDGP